MAWGRGQALLGPPQHLALGLRGERNSPRQRFCVETQTVLNFTPRPVITPAMQEPDLSLAHANERRSYTARLGMPYGREKVTFKALHLNSFCEIRALI